MRFPLGLFVAGTLLAQPAPERPKLLGVAHMSLFVSDLAKARTFYEDFLGYEEPFVLKNPDGSVQMAFVKINDQQWIELVTSPAKQDGQLNHIGLYTDNVEQMRRYLAAHGVKTPDQIVTNRIGNKKINIQDPTITASRSSNTRPPA
jgi:catechol 2,3-dioxygenase-like lactoylglutathione lyase family enzyme